MSVIVDEIWSQKIAPIRNFIQFSYKFSCDIANVAANTANIYMRYTAGKY